MQSKAVFIEDVDVYVHFMCGRFALGIPKKRLEEVFGVQAPDAYAPRYNIAPGQEVLVVESLTGSARATYRKWGLVPHWAKESRVGFKMINARSETVFDKPAFRESIRQSRCLIPAQAFYEWQQTETGKQPFAIGMKEGDTFAMAGIMAHWESGETGEVIDSFSVLTCAPNTLIKNIHDRMPVILSPDSWGQWLASEVTGRDGLEGLLKPLPAAEMKAWPVSSAVGMVRLDGPQLLEREEILRQGSLF